MNTWFRTGSTVLWEFCYWPVGEVHSCVIAFWATLMQCNELHLLEKEKKRVDTPGVEPGTTRRRDAKRA